MTQSLSRFFTVDAFRVGATVVLITVLGVGVAGAALTVTPYGDAGATIGRLTTGRSIQVVRAFGPDDEDCIFAVQRTLLPDGLLEATQELICAD